MKRMFVLAVFIMLLSVVLLNTSGTEGFESLPIISVTLSDDEYSVEVAPESSGEVNISGVVRLVGMWPEGYNNITILMEVDTGGWDFDLSGPIILDSNNTSKNFTVALHVPLGTSTSTEGSIKIFGNWVSQSADKSGSLNNDTAKIVIEKYYSFAIGADPSTASVEAGDTTALLCRLINEGNGDDRIKIEVVGHGALLEKGIAVSLSQDKFQVPEKQERSFTVTINVSTETTLENYTILLRAFSAQAEGLGYDVDDRDLKIDIEVVEEMEIDPKEGGSEDSPSFGYPLILLTLTLITFVHIFVNRRRRRS